jgi:hypothetical protein
MIFKNIDTLAPFPWWVSVSQWGCFPVSPRDVRHDVEWADMAWVGDLPKEEPPKLPRNHPGT